MGKFRTERRIYKCNLTGKEVAAKVRIDVIPNGNGPDKELEPRPYECLNKKAECKALKCAAANGNINPFK